MSYPRFALGIAAAGLFLLVCAPLRGLALWRDRRAGRWTPASFNRLLCAALGVSVRVHGCPAAARPG